MTRLHATSVVFCGHGVLLQGASGTGKSDLALRLMDAGGTLISDDYTEVAIEQGKLIASPPATLKGLIEVRHLGVRKVPFVKSARIDLVIECAGQQPDRLPEPATILVHGVKLPYYKLMALEASAVAKIRAILQTSAAHD